MKTHIATTLILGAHMAFPASAEEVPATPAINVEELIHSLDKARPEGGDISITELFEILEKQGVKVNEKEAIPSTTCGGGGGGW